MENSLSLSFLSSEFVIGNQSKSRFLLSLLDIEIYNVLSFFVTIGYVDIMFDATVCVVNCTKIVCWLHTTSHDANEMHARTIEWQDADDGLLRSFIQL